MTDQPPVKPGRDGNRQRLIDAALGAIADVGFAEASVSEIVQRAGLSRGMIHLHFNGKDALIAAAARHAAALYHAHLQHHLDRAAPGPAGCVRAIVACDLSPAVMNPRTVGIWYELRGAARTSPAIAAHSGTRDPRLERLLHDAFHALATGQGEPAPDALARDAMRGTIALLEGTWTDFMLNPDGYDTGAAERVILRFLHGLFPGDFAGDTPP